MTTSRSIMIGIDGAGGSGKTTYAIELQQQVKNSIVIHLDDFIHPKNVRYHQDYEEWDCYYRLQWRYADLIQKVLVPAKDGVHVNEMIEVYDKDTDCYTMQAFNIPIGTVIIVEGVFLQRPELRAFFDRVLYLEVDKKTRLARVLNRDTYIGDREAIRRKYETRYFPAEDVYLEQCNPLVLADAVEGK